jgi:hypothetical protein
MSVRREFLSYIGTGAIGSIVGYYIGAQELLGIQSDQIARRNPEEPAEEPTEEPAEEPTEEPAEEPTEEPADMDLPPLMARYTFEGSGSTIEDVTGNGYEGDLQNASRVNGYDGQSLQFERSNQEFATFGSADELDPRDGSIAVEYRFKSSSDDGKNELVTKRGGDNVFMRTLLRNGRVQFMLKDTSAVSAGSSAVTTEETYNDGEWHHVLAFRDTANGQLRLWVDGTEHNGDDEQTNINASGSWLVGGNPRYPNPHYTEGMIDNLQIYK